MLIPYNVKNPVRRFPYVTVGLTVANAAVFLLTTENMEVRDDIVDRYALRWGASPLITLVTSQFLHGDVLHLLGNMLFLWVFGPAVEDRVGPIRYIVFYFLTGFAGEVMEAVLGMTVETSGSVAILGSSGCISGIIGAYWYLYSWSPVRILCCVAWFWQGTFEVPAIWFIGAYFALDLSMGFLDRVGVTSHDVASFAHVGGTFVGLLVVWALGFKRDSREVSAVKANAVSYRCDRHLMNCSELRVLVEQSGDDEELLADYARAAMLDDSPDDLRLALERNPTAMIARCPEVVLHYLLILKGDPRVFPGDTLLRLALQCERQNQSVSARQLYDVIAARAADFRCAEIALYRAAGISWRRLGDGGAALERLHAMLARFPHGSLALDAEDLRNEITRRKDLAA